MMCLLADKSPVSKMPGKRFLEYGGCQRPSFPPNFKRPKVDAIRQFPKHCGALAPRVNKRRTEGVTGVAATGNLEVGKKVPMEVGEKGPIVPAKPSLVSLGKLGALERRLTTPKIVEMESTKDIAVELVRQPEQIDALGSLKTSSQPQLLARKYPPPRIWKGVAVFRQFPSGCGILNCVPSSKTKVLVCGKSGLGERPMEETIHMDDKIGDKTLEDACSLDKKLEENRSEEIANKVQLQLGSALVQSDFKYQLVSNNDDGTRSLKLDGENDDGTRTLVGRVGEDPEKSNMDKFAEYEIDMMMGSQGLGALCLPSLHGGPVIAKQQGQKVSSGELTESICRYKGQKCEFMDADASRSLSLKQEDSRASEQKTTEERSLISGVEAANQMDAVFDESKKHDYILEARESNEQSIVLFDDYQAVSLNRVREALNLFEKTFQDLLQCEANPKGQGMAGRQIHIEAAMLLKQQNKWVNTGKPLLGAVPGVEVGDQFQFRVELAIIGLHRQFVAGIDFMTKDGKTLATSIVASGRYANETESSDVLIYSGQGGNPKMSHKKPEDQKLERGNLALVNSMNAKTPVRVIRGRQTLKAFKTTGIKGEKILTYIYDGLYIVSTCRQERGQYGKLVFMFQLNRIPGQPKITLDEVSKSKKSKPFRGDCVVGDISQGKEKISIGAMNAIDDEKPPSFEYMANVVYPEWCDLTMPSGCNCTDGCSLFEPCSCAMKNGGKIPFNHNGAINKAKPIVYECGPSCKCPPSCKNRVSQHGVRYQLEVFKTESRGWGVRSRNYISSGSFICEYVGELLHEEEAEQRTGHDEYLFDIGNTHEDHVIQDESVTLPDSVAVDNDFAIDAAKRGNVGRFVNHSCSPNLYAQNVLYDHDDKRMPHIMLFAAKNIPPLKELTYDYNYKIDQVRDVNGNIKKKNCYCGSLECTGRMY